MSRLGGQRYNVAIVRELASFRPFAYDVVIDGERSRAAACWCPSATVRSYGGGMRVCPDARLDDGLLDVTWLGAVSKVTFLRVLPQRLQRHARAHPSVTHVLAARSITIDAPGQIAYADGERIGPAAGVDRRATGSPARAERLTHRGTS